MRNITLMDTREIATDFYSAFTKGDAETMISSVYNICFLSERWNAQINIVGWFTILLMGIS